MRSRRGAGRSGFTLIELLTVIAIIAVLASLLMTAVMSAQESGKLAFCKNNLRQLHSLILMYTTSYGGYLPGMWHERWVGELALAGKQWPPGNHPHDNSPYVGQVWENLSPNPLGAFPIRSGAGFLVCKSDLSGYRCDQGCLCSYMGLSKYGWHHLRQENLAAYEYHQIQEFDEPTRRIMLCETEPAVFQSGGCGCRWTAYSWPDEVIKRHYGGGNILFFDGHVELAKDPEKRKLLYWEPDYKATWPGW